MACGPISNTRLKNTSRTGLCSRKGCSTPRRSTCFAAPPRKTRQLDQHSFGRADGEGGTVRLSLWNHPGDGIYGMFARCESMVNSAERLLGGEVYHYHSKMIMKDAKVGGAWAWHQDYGYWYQNGVLFPLLDERVHRRGSGARERTAACR